MESILVKHIEKTPGICGGRACIAGHRIRVVDIVTWHEKRGYCPDEIVALFPGITLADVYAALTYYFDNRDEIEDDLRQSDKSAAWVKANIPSKIPAELREKHGVADPLRFFMDQHFPAPASQGLRRHGVDVLTAQEAGRCGCSDTDQLSFASAAGRVMVSFYSDFLTLHQSGGAHGGIAWCQEQKYGIGPLIQALLLLHGVLDRESMRNHVEYL